EHKLIETAENLISREFLLPKDFPNLTHELPFYGLEEVELITGHGWMCSHPDYLNWIKEKIKIDENLGRPLKIKPEHPIKKIFRKIVLGFKIKGTFRKLQIVNHKMPEELYSTSYVKERTIKFLEKFAENEYSKENFFTFCSFPDPHHSFSPPERYLKMYKPEDIKLNATFYDNHEKSPGFMKKHYNEGVNTDGTTKKLFITPKDLTELDAQRVIAASYGMEKMIDDAVGEILDTLEKTGLAENTVVIYTTDHGELGGDHRFFFKGPFLYEALAKIPFLIKVPNLGNKKVSSSLTSSLDIAETILELAELPIPDSMQGKSLVPILKNPDGKINEEVLIEMDEEIMGEITRTLITDGKRITIFMAPENDGELYDLIDDPDEMNNLWKEESYKEIKTNLLIKLAKKMGLKITENSEMEQILDGIRDYLRNYNSPITRECQF
ncbi:MAG: sulfatase-like hydrolase/transferase, partial [archaeon]|nr:sulfatase-like hydrolase/transferase [archaeon]